MVSRKTLRIILVICIFLLMIWGKLHIITTREIKYGAFLADSPTTENINDFEALQERPLDVVNMFINWDTNFSSIKSNFDAVYTNSSIMCLTWEAYGFSNSDITNGLKDDYIKQMAYDLKNYNKEVIVRLFHEGNGNWYDWSIGDSTVNTDETYIDAYRHVVDIFKKAGATNVKWDFTINADNVGLGSSFLGHYPGSKYVDIISIDGYNWGTTQDWGSTWQSFDKIFSKAYHAVKFKRKPISISEFSSTEIGGDKGKWYTDAFNDINSHKYRLIDTVMVFSVDKETDWRINSSEEALEGYIKGIHIS